jgi:hypothetical protein
VAAAIFRDGARHAIVDRKHLGNAEVECLAL